MIPKYNFCTEFDKNYLYKGLALYFSLKRFLKENFIIWILCFDDLTYKILSKLNENQIKLVKLEEFENENLKRVKKERSFVEYAWTCTSNFMLYLLENKNIDSIAYLDADLYFFNNPKVIFDEIEDSSLAIVEHRYSKNRKHFEGSAGKFNVSFVYAKNDENGRKAIKWWAKKVIDWCYDRYENGKFGDQKYLDEFPKLFPFVKIIQHKGVNVAPWNISSYEIGKENNTIYINNEPLIFYHFHRFYILDKEKYIEASRYYVPKDAKKSIYQPYWEEIKSIMNLVKNIDPEFNFGFKKLNKYELFIECFFRFKIFEQIYLLLSQLKHLIINLIKK
ncbi:MAG: glycosyl transferase [Minisyncoccia bacterium]